MNTLIEQQIENINSALEWIKLNNPGDYDLKFQQLVEERRKLKKLHAAQMDNPAIAAYGVSQVGKSYLINCLLQKDGKPFMLESADRDYNFIEEMNPKTDNTEATGVVTRFSSFSKAPEMYSKEYPILMRCMSITDAVTVLADGYYNDVQDYTTYSEDEIKEYLDQLYARYYSAQPISKPVVTADDVLDMNSYFKKFINNAQAFLHKGFFEKLALIIEKVPATDMLDIFSVLWHRSPYQTKLLQKMLSTLEKFQYSRHIYLPPQAMLHDGINENTVMSVQCLNELFLDAPKYFTDAYLKNGDSFTKVPQLTKSEVCAVCSEIIIKIGDKYLNNTNFYSLQGISDPNVVSALSEGHEVEDITLTDSATGQTTTFKGIRIKSDVLSNNDMLDFPGARSRKKEQLETLQEDSILINVLLRGKVAFLFNQYNEAMLINILLYCHHAAQHDVNDIPGLINNWLMNYVGDTMDKRKKTMELTGGISPFFYVGTKFNIDMEFKPETIQNEINALNGRWYQRFEKVLAATCFNSEGNLDAEKKPIFHNWTRAGEDFSNSYVLRDFKFSSPKASRLYDGERTPSHNMLITKEHYENMRQTFCSSECVKRLFGNPQLSWDVAASIDNDGALYIIERLAKVAKNMEATRDHIFRDILDGATRKVLDTIQDYYISSDIDQLLEDNIRKARAVYRDMDFTCNKDNYYFGHLLQALQITETDCYQILHQIMQSPELIDKGVNFEDYEIIYTRCNRSGHPIEQAQSTPEKWQCIIDTYGFYSIDEAKEFLLGKNINPEELFAQNFERKLNSCIIADTVFDAWCANIKSAEFIGAFSGDNGMTGSVMSSMVENMIRTAENLNIRDMMAKSIADYVNVVDVHTANESLLADILADRINDFVLDLGYEYISTEDREKVRNICQKRNLPAFQYMEQERQSTYTEEDLTALFNSMAARPQALLQSFENNYNTWIEYMFISFIANLNIPDFDHDANVALEKIINNIRQ